MLTGPRVAGSRKANRDLAYACFLPPAIISLVSAVGTVVPMDSGTAGGIGFLVLIPLAMLTLVSVPAGLYLSVIFHKDLVLPLLSALTIMRIVEVITEAGSTAFYNATAWVHGILTVILVGSWFFARRWRSFDG